jgi:hypothetical protein
MHQLTHLLEAGFLRGAKQGKTLGFQRRKLFTQELVMGIHPKHTTTQATRDGGGCEADTADTTRKKTGMRLRPHVGGGVCQAARNGKKVLKSGGQGTSCLLTGAF